MKHPKDPQDHPPDEAIRAYALTLGFDCLGVTTATLPPEAHDRLQSFLIDEKQGDMDWLKERAAQRSHPQALWPEARSIITVGVNYGPDHHPLDNLAFKSQGNISVYARHRDYHDVIKKRLRAFATWIAKTFKTEVKIFVDTAPVMEKPLAQQASLGWMGKHTNIVSRSYGSWLFLGEIFTSLPLHPDAPQPDHCGCCTRCISICPTRAIVAPYNVDARRCISYLTIEHKGPIPREFRKAMGNRIYGCDDCLAVCPWNRFAKTCSHDDLKPKTENTLPPLLDLITLDDPQFRSRFSGSPIKRIGRDRFIRNVLIAIGNSNDPRTFEQSVIDRLTDSSPLVRGAAVWALKQLTPKIAQKNKKRFLMKENDADVISEWQCDQ